MKNLNYNEYKQYFINKLELVDEEQVNKLIDIILNAFENDNKIFVIGNGGSAANASHFAQDMAKGTRESAETKKRIKATSLTDNVPFITALGNDDGYETIFEQQLRTFAGKGDVLIAISGSGNSPNIIKAVEWANENDLITVGITGYDGGKLKRINKFSVHTELSDMATVESIHSYILHYVIIKLREKFGLPPIY